MCDQRFPEPRDHFLEPAPVEMIENQGLGQRPGIRRVHHQLSGAVFVKGENDPVPRRHAPAQLGTGKEIGKIPHLPDLDRHPAGSHHPGRGHRHQFRLSGKGSHGVRHQFEHSLVFGFFDRGHRARVNDRTGDLLGRDQKLAFPALPDKRTPRRPAASEGQIHGQAQLPGDPAGGPDLFEEGIIPDGFDLGVGDQVGRGQAVGKGLDLHAAEALAPEKL